MMLVVDWLLSTLLNIAVFQSAAMDLPEYAATGKQHAITTIDQTSTNHHNYLRT
jgi:hypothetical protein